MDVLDFVRFSFLPLAGILITEKPGTDMTMEEKVSDATENQDSGESTPQAPPWARASVADLADVDFEAHDQLHVASRCRHRWAQRSNT
jgi:hypothetical protein